MFRNLTLFASPKGWQPDATLIRNNLSAPNILGSGWTIVRDDEPYINVFGQIFMVLETQKKLLPMSVVNKEVKLKSDEFANKHGRSALTKTIIRGIKESIYEEMYKKAFITSTFTKVWINPKDGILGIDSISDSRIDEVFKYLMALDFKGTRLKTEIIPSSFMVNLMLSEEGLTNFTADRSCELKGDEGRSVKYKNEPLDTDDVRDHISQGKRPVNLAMTYNNKISFVLHDNLGIGKIGLIDIESQEAESKEEQFDNDFTLITSECTELIKALTVELGGVADHAQ